MIEEIKNLLSALAASPVVFWLLGGIVICVIGKYERKTLDRKIIAAYGFDESFMSLSDGEKLSKMFGVIVAMLRDLFAEDLEEAPEDPPRAAEFIIGVFAKKRYRKSILSDLAEDFALDIASGMSIRRARRRYWAAAVASVAPQAYAALKRIGVLGLLLEAARRFIGAS